MIGVGAARESARARLASRLGTWAAELPEGAVFNLSLKPPSEREVRSDEAAAERWAREWQALRAPGGVEIEFEVRAWRSIGRQRIPVRLRASTPDALAAFAGGDAARDWAVLSSRAAELRDRLGEGPALSAVVQRQGDFIRRLDAKRFAEVVEVSSWLATNPVTGLRPRQLPIRGVDTKWFGAHRGLVTALHGAVTDARSLGIVDADPLVRIRVLDRDLAVGGLVDLAAPASQLAALCVDPRLVFIVENLETVLALPAWEGAIAVHGSGYAVDVSGALPWVQRSPVVYWGDLDSNGFAILHQLRSAHASVESVLMDEDTLIEHSDLWVTEPKPNRGTFDTLTGAEQRALQRLRDEGHVRLEQERIPWARALAALHRVDAPGRYPHR